MKTGWVRVPKKVIEHVREILDRPVVTRERIEKEIVPERFESEKRAFYEWIISGVDNVVPDDPSLDGAKSDNAVDGSKKKITPTSLASKLNNDRTKRSAARKLTRNLNNE